VARGDQDTHKPQKVTWYPPRVFACAAVVTSSARRTRRPKGIPPEVVAKLAAEVREKGNAQHGAEVYRRTELLCTTCHKIADQGGQLGPSLDATRQRAAPDFIIGAVLDPQREIKEGFETWEITTRRRKGSGRAWWSAAGRNEIDKCAMPPVSEERIPMAQVATRKLGGFAHAGGAYDRPALTRRCFAIFFAYLAQLGRRDDPAKSAIRSEGRCGPPLAQSLAPPESARPQPARTIGTSICQHSELDSEEADQADDDQVDRERRSYSGF
jgi:putative heme-binding domain-containing protein